MLSNATVLKRYDLRFVRNEGYFLEEMSVPWCKYLSLSNVLQFQCTRYLLTATTPQFETQLELWSISGNTRHERNSQNSSFSNITELKPLFCTQLHLKSSYKVCVTTARFIQIRINTNLSQ